MKRGRQEVTGKVCLGESRDAQYRSEDKLGVSLFPLPIMWNQALNSGHYARQQGLLPIK